MNWGRQCRWQFTHLSFDSNDPHHWFLLIVSQMRRRLMQRFTKKNVWNLASRNNSLFNYSHSPALASIEFTDIPIYTYVYARVSLNKSTPLFLVYFWIFTYSSLLLNEIFSSFSIFYFVCICYLLLQKQFSMKNKMEGKIEHI